LSTAAVGREANEHGSVIHYYFGNKAGLVAALVDSLVEEPDLMVRANVDAVGDPGHKVEELLLEHEGIAAAREDLRLYYELLPYILRDRALCERVAREYRSARAYDALVLASALGAASDQSEMMGALTLGLVDGLGLHAALDPEEIDVHRVYEVWRDMVTVYLRELAVRATAADA
jgi:AcrR family transcriptional regulator